MSTFSDRFWHRVSIGAPDDCWLWQGHLRGGYGRIRVGKRKHNAHRVAYELAVGAIPEGLHVDHTCRTRDCCNPKHLEPVTCKVNILRGTGQAARNAKKTHCLNGHEFTSANTKIRIRRRGRIERECVRCARQYQKEYRLRIT